MTQNKSIIIVTLMLHFWINSAHAFLAKEWVIIDQSPSYPKAQIIDSSDGKLIVKSSLGVMELEPKKVLPLLNEYSNLKTGQWVIEQKSNIKGELSGFAKIGDSGFVALLKSESGETTLINPVFNLISAPQAVTEAQFGKPKSGLKSPKSLPFEVISPSEPWHIPPSSQFGNSTPKKDNPFDKDPESAPFKKDQTVLYLPTEKIAIITKVNPDQTLDLKTYDGNHEEDQVLSHIDSTKISPSVTQKDNYCTGNYVKIKGFNSKWKIDYLFKDSHALLRFDDQKTQLTTTDQIENTLGSKQCSALSKND